VRSLHRALIQLAFLVTTPALAVLGPVPDDADRGAADVVARMADASPQDRVVKLLKASELSREALFVLAGFDPLLVDQVVDGRTSLVLAYLKAMPATEMVDLRAGNTVVRHAAGWSKAETERLVAIAEEAELKKPKSLETVRVGVMPGSSMRFELFGKKGNVEVEFAIAPTPVREDRAREKLTRYFSAQPAAIMRGPGTRLPLEDASFEQPASIGGVWTLEPCVTRSGTIPAAQISLDTDEKLDGRSSVRFNSDIDTRYWPQLSQSVAIAPGTSLVLRGHIKARYLRRERDQERVFRLAMEFTDIDGNPVGAPVEAPLQTGDMEWRQFVMSTYAPPDADFVKVVLACTVSGTAWFDGLSLEIGY
jgi:hypothetical protein